MCNVAGFYSLSPQKRPQQIELFVRLLLEGSIRGRHATGVYSNYTLTKQPCPADEFLSSHKAEINSIGHMAIGHNRYDTSGTFTDNRNNQPLKLKNLVLAHNGIVSMSSDFPHLFGVNSHSGNDSEVILHRTLAGGQIASLSAISQGISEIAKISMPIFACAMYDEIINTLFLFRDDVRPLHLYWIEELDAYVFASTKDIFLRANGGRYDWHEIYLQPFVVYQINNHGMDFQRIPLQPRQHPQYDRRTRVVLEPKMGYGLHHKDDYQVEKQVDYRVNRREAFIDYYASILASWDVDPPYPLFTYLFDRYELSREQEFWTCWLYGIFYHPASVHWVLNEFPDFEKVDVDRLERWHNQHWKLLQYETDRRHEKGRFVKAFLSYRDWIGNQTQEQKLCSFLTDDPYQSFDRLWADINKKLFSFGRYASFYYTEALARCIGLPILPSDIFLKDADSTRNGLCHALKREDLVDNKHLTKADYDFLEEELCNLITDIRKTHPTVPVDMWYLETALCAYKGLFRRRRYVGYYIDRLYEQIYEIKKLDHNGITCGVDWEPLEDFRRECLEPFYVHQTGYRQECLNAMIDEGRLINIHPIALKSVSVPEHVRGEIKPAPQKYKPVNERRLIDYAMLAKLNAVAMNCKRSLQIYELMRSKETK